MDQWHGFSHAPPTFVQLHPGVSTQVVEVGRCVSSYGTMTLPGSTTQDLEGVETTVEMETVGYYTPKI